MFFVLGLILVSDYATKRTLAGELVLGLGLLKENPYGDHRLFANRFPTKKRQFSNKKTFLKSWSFYQAGKRFKRPSFLLSLGFCFRLRGPQRGSERIFGFYLFFGLGFPKGPLVPPEKGSKSKAQNKETE